MYQGIVYFAGARSRWDGRAHPAETIAYVCAPWRWLARMQLLGIHRTLDASKCGYALLRDGECIEQYDPPIPEPELPKWMVGGA